MRSAIAGLIVGLVLGVLGMWLAGRGRESHEGPAVTRPGEAAAPRDDAEKARQQAETALETSRKEIASLKERIGELEKRDATAKEPVKGTPGHAATSVSREKWSKIAAMMWKLRAQMKNGGADGAESQEMGTELLALLAQISKELGVTINEAVFAPEGFPTLLLAILDAAGAPPDAAGADAALAASRGAWDEYVASREKLTKLEQKRALYDVEDKAIAAIRSGLTPAQDSALVETGLLGTALSLGDSGRFFSGTRESVAASLNDAWSGSLALDASQKAALGPVVDEFMRGYDALEANAKGTEREKIAAQLDLAIRAQKRIRETMRLSPEQEKSLADWCENDGYSLSEGEGPR